MSNQFQLPKPFATWKEDDDDCGAWGRSEKPVFTAEQMRWAYEQGLLTRAARCVNSHDALVKALKDCVRVFENELSGLAVIGPELRQARAALCQPAEEGDKA